VRATFCCGAAAAARRIACKRRRAAMNGAYHAPSCPLLCCCIAYAAALRNATSTTHNTHKHVRCCTRACSLCFSFARCRFALSLTHTAKTQSPL
jgi:hypothetical protein